MIAKAERLSTAVEIATELGVHRLTISRIARVNSIGRTFGNTRVFTKNESIRIKKMCRISRGNPCFGKKSKNV